MKLHLTMRPTHEAAWRLAWFLGRHDDVEAAIERLARFVGQHVSFVDRLLSGELLPGGDLAHQIWLATEGAVWRVDWRRPAGGEWYDEPRVRETTRRAA